jgi:hypothetical protein
MRKELGTKENDVCDKVSDLIAENKALKAKLETVSKALA